MNLNLQTTSIYREKLVADLHLSLVKVEGGSYRMGQDEGEKGHEVNLSDFYMGQYPITVAQYLLFVNETENHFPEWLEEGSDYHLYQGSDNHYKQLGEALTHPLHPIVGVNWHNAVAYCEWLSLKTKKNYRLPSEAEWEYAARGGRHSQGFPYAGSHKLKEVAWYDLNSNEETKQVGLKLPNELGLYDTSGNVWEWCLDHWQDERNRIPQDGTPWLDAEQTATPTASRVVRGGSWYDIDSNCRVSTRDFSLADIRDDYIGFRVVRY